MKIKNFFFKNLWVLVSFFITTYTQSMVSPYQQSTIDAQLHNHNQLIMDLPNEIWVHIFSYCRAEVIEGKQLLHTFFKHCAIFKNICKCFNDMITINVIAELCKGHTPENKDKVLQQITRELTRANYCMNRPVVLALLYAGASPNIGNYTKYNVHLNDVTYANFSLLHKVLIQNDNDLCIKLISDFNADPNQLHPNKCPLFFLVNNTVLADLFFKKGVDINAKDKDGNNVFWYLHQLSLELIQFYINHGVDTRYINPVDGGCILHVLANPTFKNIYNSNDFYKKGVLLIKTIPDMINMLNKKGKTPIDLMEEKIKREFYKHSTFYAKQFKELIATYRDCNGKTGQELKQEK